MMTLSRNLLPPSRAPSAWQSFRSSIWALLVPVIILGGIYSGIFTPTEAGAVAVVYAALIGIFVYGDISVKDLPEILASSAKDQRHNFGACGYGNCLWKIDHTGAYSK